MVIISGLGYLYFCFCSVHACLLGKILNPEVPRLLYHWRSNPYIREMLLSLAFKLGLGLAPIILKIQSKSINLLSHNEINKTTECNMEYDFFSKLKKMNISKKKEKEKKGIIFQLF